MTDGIADAFFAATQGVQETTKLKAQRGSAAYYQDASIGKQDAGSITGMQIIKGFYQQSATNVANQV